MLSRVLFRSDNWQIRVGFFTYVDPADIPDKEVVIVGCNYINSDIRKEVIQFNKTNSNYRIILKDYSTYNTMDDYNASYTQMNNDIISGQMPDIMLIDTNLSIESYAKKGLLADVRELINQDEELSQNEYLENVWEAFSIDGKLYNVIPTFSVNTMVAKTSLVGDRMGWTMEEFMQALNEMPEGIKPFGETIQSSFMYNILNYSGKDFVDIQNSKCYFDTQDFIDILEFANTLPKEYASDYWEDYDYSSYKSE